MRSAFVACMLAATTAHADDGDRWDGGTIGLQAFGAMGTGALLGAATGLVGGLIGNAISSNNWGVPLAGALIGGSIGLGVGIVWGVNHIGDLRGANGSPGATTAGLLCGVFAFGTLTVISEKANWKTPKSVRALEAIVFLVGGPVIGYHLSADAKADPTARVVIPLLGGGF